MKETKAELDHWQFLCTEAGLAKSTDIDAMTEECKLFRSPTIVFDRNTFTAQDKQGRIQVTYNAKEAMRFINYELRQQQYNAPEDQGKINTISYIPQKLYVQHAQHWKNLDKPKDIEITEVKETSDSFYLSSFKGHIEG